MSRGTRKAALVLFITAVIVTVLHLQSSGWSDGDLTEMQPPDLQDPQQMEQIMQHHSEHDDDRAVPAPHENTDTSHITEQVLGSSSSSNSRPADLSKRPRACFVILTRNGELKDLRETLTVFERQFNHRYHYPYVFLNDVPFTQHFKTEVAAVIGPESTIEFGLVPKEHWSYPPWILKSKAAKTREDMREIIYGSSESYRFMCHYQSGYFFRHPLLAKYDYYWRIEPGTRLVCEVPYDPFLKMRNEGLKYGFNIAIGEYEATVPTLWEATMNYVAERHEVDDKFNPTLLNFFATDDHSKYNLRHFWSNFELGDLNFLRSDDYVGYFDHLDRAGGFFYERWGDAPVHSLGVGLFLKKEEVHFFEDIGYYHVPLTHCPAEPFHTERKCDCDREKSADKILHWACIEQWKEYTPKPWFPV